MWNFVQNFSATLMVEEFVDDLKANFNKCSNARYYCFEVILAALSNHLVISNLNGLKRYLFFTYKFQNDKQN